MRQISKTLIGAAGVSLGPALAVFSGYMQQHPVWALGILAIYELLVLFVSVAAGAFGELRTRWIDRLTELVDSRIQRWTSRYGRSYNQFIIATNSHMDLKGLSTRGEYALELGRVYIQLGLESTVPHDLSASPLEYSALRVRVRRHISQRPIDMQSSDPASHTIWDSMAVAHSDNTVLAIIGPPGSGKTTLVKHTALVLARGGRAARRLRAPNKIPVVVTLRDHKAKFTSPESDSISLADVIRDSVVDMVSAEPPRWIESKLQKGQFVVMLDGLDEISVGDTRKRVSEWVEKQNLAFPDTVFVVTSRPFGYQSAPLNAATIVQVQPFTERHVRRFIDTWYLTTMVRTYGEESDAARLEAKRSAANLMDKLYESTKLLSLTVNPLLLTMIANVHHYRGALPGSRVELYKEICEVLLGKRHQARGIELTMSAAQKQAVLQELAYRMMHEGIRDVDPQRASAWIKLPLSRVAPSISELDFLRHVEESSGLLIEREHSSYTFAHLTFQEYLASVHVRENRDIGTLLGYLWSSWWRETIVLYAAQADATDIVERCLDNMDDLSLLGLATQCSEESREISLRARRALTAFTEGNVRLDRKKRRAAAAVLLFRRNRNFSRLDEDSYFCADPITCLEYQLFIDETQSPDSVIPDHWHEELFPEGHENFPVVGVRGSDARRFTNWLQELYGGEWSYSLPVKERFDRRLLAPCPTERRVSTTFGIDTHDYIVDWVNRVNEDALYQQDETSYREPDDYVYPIVPDEFELSDEVLVEQMSFDLSETINHPQRVFGGAGMDGDWYIQNNDLDLGASISSTNLAALIDIDSPEYSRIKSKLRLVQSVDVGRLVQRVETICQTALAVEMLDRKSKIDVFRLSQTISLLVPVAFNRSTKPYSRINNSREERLLCRLMCLAVSRILLREGLSSTQAYRIEPTTDPKVGLVKRIFRRSLKAGAVTSGITEWSDAGKQTGLLALVAEFELLYVSLVLVESRIRGKSPAWEGIYISRSS